MHESAAVRKIPAPALLALASLILALAGCGPSRDTEMAEKLARAEQAAREAEAARRAVENAAKSGSSRPSQPAAVWDEGPEPGADVQSAEGIDDSEKFDNTIAGSPDD